MDMTLSILAVLSRQTSARPLMPLNPLFTQAIRQSSFNCITQFMLAMQAVLSEAHGEGDGIGETSRTEDENSAATGSGQGMDDVNRLVVALKRRRCPQDISKDLHQAPLFAILRSRDPRRQKSEARRIGIVQGTPRAVADGIVIAAIICRANEIPLLKELILRSGNRKFAYATVPKTFWNIGLSLSDSDIVREARWQGSNRLGWCYGRAREYLRGEPFTDGSNDGKVNGTS